ncbi:MAG: hypothetical protein C0515_04820 [Novosphingobium sp.]|nr:hypothetical protein [Novosphingobium sp.]MBX9644487.1 hypothetical protein [Novosphingobium sp.]
MKLTKIALAAAGLCVTVVPAGAFAPSVDVGSAQFTIGVVGYVPVICRASVEAGSVAPVAGTTSLGLLKEFCNSPTGYRVVADYSPALAQAKLIVDGQVVPLHEDGSTVVRQSNSAAIADHTLALELPENGQVGNISFRIEPR